MDALPLTTASGATVPVTGSNHSGALPIFGRPMSMDAGWSEWFITKKTTVPSASRAWAVSGEPFGVMLWPMMRTLLGSPHWRSA